MRKLFNLSLLMIIGMSIILISCEKDEEEESKPEPSMTALIDGAEWSATQMGCSVTLGQAGISGTKSQEPTIILSLEGFEVGTYTCQKNSQSVCVVTIGNISYATNADSEAGGTVTISSINTADSVLSGSFEFVGYSPVGKGLKSITGGVFINIPFTNKMPETPDHTLEVEIDGTTFTAASVMASSLMGKIIISASDSPLTKTIGITFPEGTEKGTYELSTFGSYIGQYNIGSTIIMSPSCGTLEITKHDATNNIYEGTFEFEAEEMLGSNSASLTNGSFVVSY